MSSQIWHHRNVVLYLLYPFVDLRIPVSVCNSLSRIWTFVYYWHNGTHLDVTYNSPVYSIKFMEGCFLEVIHAVTFRYIFINPFFVLVSCHYLKWLKNEWQLIQTPKTWATMAPSWIYWCCFINSSHSSLYMLT